MGQVTTVTIGAVAYSVYGERAADGGTPQGSADEYLAGSFRWATTWAALSDDQKSRCLVEATRWLDRQKWAGTRSSGAQPLQWPREGATYSDGSAVPGTPFVPDELVAACYELAVLVSTKPAASSALPSAAGNIKRVEGGPAKVEFFRPDLGVPSSGFPPDVQAMIAQFLAGASATSVGPSYVTGTGDESTFAGEIPHYGVGEP